MRAMMNHFFAWLRGDHRQLPPPTPEQQEVLDVIARMERKLEARRRDRQRMFDLQVDVLTRQEPDTDA